MFDRYARVFLAIIELSRINAKSLELKLEFTSRLNFKSRSCLEALSADVCICACVRARDVRVISTRDFPAFLSSSSSSARCAGTRAADIAVPVVAVNEFGFNSRRAAVGGPAHIVPSIGAMRQSYNLA